MEWSNDCLDALNGVEKSYQGKDTSEIIYSKAEQVFYILLAKLQAFRDFVLCLSFLN